MGHGVVQLSAAARLADVSAMTRKRKQPSDRLSSLAGRVLQGYAPTEAEIRSLAAAVLSLDVVPGTNEPPRDG